MIRPTHNKIRREVPSVSSRQLSGKDSKSKFEPGVMSKSEPGVMSKSEPGIRSNFEPVNKSTAALTSGARRVTEKRQKRSFKPVARFGLVPSTCSKSLGRLSSPEWNERGSGSLPSSKKVELFTIPYSVKASNTSLRTDRSIPYRIMQTMKTTRVPVGMYRAARSWIDKNPEYDYEFFDDERCNQYVKDHYDVDVLTKFMVINVGAAKADLFRWLYLNIEGGLYFDADTKCVKPIREWYKKECDRYKEVFFSTVPSRFTERWKSSHLKQMRQCCLYPDCINKHNKKLPREPGYRSCTHNGIRINHYIIMTTPGHALIRTAMNLSFETFHEAFNKKRDVNLPQDLCGPQVLGEALNKLLRRPLTEKRVLPKDSNRPTIQFVGENSAVILWVRGPNKYGDIHMRYEGYSTDYEETLSCKRYGQDVPAFSYKNCLRYLQQHRVNLNGEKLYAKTTHDGKCIKVNTEQVLSC